ncbi:MAG: DUF1573 domain-containing protein [Bacteroidales bacterium]|jgi:hypothetical protein
MKKSILLLLVAGAMVFSTLPVKAQKKVTLQEIQKETLKNQGSQAGATTVANPAGATAPVKNGSGVKPGAVQSTITPQPNVVAPVTQTAAVAAPAVPPTPLTCTWDVTDYDFGKNVTQGKPASATFNITNAGKEPVTITLVQPSCGCTSPKYTKEPIKPGEKGEVVLTYDAKISGYFSKSAQVKLNDGQKYALTIKGEVQKVDQPASTDVIK